MSTSVFSKLCKGVELKERTARKYGFYDYKINLENNYLVRTCWLGGWAFLEVTTDI